MNSNEAYDNTRNCEPCSAEQNQYEDDIVSSLITWFEMVTCIPWIRAYPDASRPDENETNYKQGQYGVIHVDSIQTHYTNNAYNGNVGENELCRVIENRLTVSISLTVFRAAQMNPETGTRLRQPSDILQRINDVYFGIPRLQQLIQQDQEIKFTDFGRISNSSELVESHYQRRATQNIELCVQRKTSFAESLINGYELSLDCNQTEDCRG